MEYIQNIQDKVKKQVTINNSSVQTQTNKTGQ